MRLDVRKNIFTMNVVKHQNRFPREGLEISFLETSVRWDGTLSDLI